jgi:hypothetical protein
MKAGGGYNTHSGIIIYVLCSKPTYSDTHNCGQHATIKGGTQQLSELQGNKLRKLKHAQILLQTSVVAINQDQTGATVLALLKGNKDAVGFLYDSLLRIYLTSAIFDVNM